MNSERASGSRRARTNSSRVVPAGVDEFPALIERAVESSPHLTIDKKDETSVELYRRTNWLTWGETLVATFSATDTTRTLVTVSSRPTFPLQVQDWGQSRKDVEALLDAVTAVAEGTAAPVSETTGTGRRSSRLLRQAPLGVVIVAAAACIIAGTLLLVQH